MNNVSISKTEVNISATFYFEDNFSWGYSKVYSIATFDINTAAADMKDTWNIINAKKQLQIAFRRSKPPAAYIDTANPEFP